jgi:hypothetical protein
MSIAVTKYKTAARMLRALLGIYRRGLHLHDQLDFAGSAKRGLTCLLQGRSGVSIARSDLPATELTYGSGHTFACLASTITAANNTTPQHNTAVLRIIVLGMVMGRKEDGS